MSPPNNRPPDNEGSDLRNGTDPRTTESWLANATLLLVQRVWSELAKYVAKFVAAVILLIVAVLSFVVLKWALGIFDIENHLKVIGQEINSKEDTIFSYSYEYSFPRFDMERQLLNAVDTEPTLEDIVVATYSEYSNIMKNLKNEGHITDETHEVIEKTRDQLRSPIEREFTFSAAADTEVILVYELNCYSPEGHRLEDPIAFGVRVNETDFTPFESWEGKFWLTWHEHLSKKQPIIETRTKHMLSEQTLKLSIFVTRTNDEDQLRQNVKRRLNGKIERCSFEAMIFVRDELNAFEAKGLIPYLLAYFGMKSPSQGVIDEE